MAKGDFETTIWRFGNGTSVNRSIIIKQDVGNISSPIRILRKGFPTEFIIKPPISNSKSINFLRWMSFGDQYLLVLETLMPPNMDPKCSRKVYVIDTLPRHQIKKIEIAKHKLASEPRVSYRKTDGDIFLIYMADRFAIARNLGFHRSDNGKIICPHRISPELVGGRNIFGNHIGSVLSMKWTAPRPDLPPLPVPCPYTFTPSI